jgi:ABC-2 type transport system ATP-binding protein
MKILEIKNLHLSFPGNLHKPSSIRDSFVKSLSNPIGLFKRSSDSVEVIKGLDLTVSKGDRVALLGVNGAGKTSLCRAIAGFYKATGSLKISGQVRAIFDTIVGIYPELTGRENAKILANLLYVDLDHLDDKIEEALIFSELGDFLDAPFKHYSNGMQTRLCLAVLTLAPTDLLILDEVFEGADQFFRKKISERVSKMVKNSNASIFVSHSEDQIRRVCNRAVLLHQGKIIFDGSVTEGLRFYADFYDSKSSLSV